MKKNQLITLAIIASTLIISDLIQRSGWHPDPIIWLHAAWLANSAIAIWTIVSIGRIRPHEPEHSPLEYGGAFLYLMGAMAFYIIACGLIKDLSASLSPTIHAAIEESSKVHEWSEQRSLFGNLWPLIAAPVLEEIIYRVGLLGALMQIMRKPWAILLSAAIFALSHASIYPAPVVAATFIFGLLASATYLMLGLRAAIMLHLLNNSRDWWLPWIRDYDYLFTGYIVISLAALIVFIHHMIRHRRLVLR